MKRLFCRGWHRTSWLVLLGLAVGADGPRVRADEVIPADPAGEFRRRQPQFEIPSQGLLAGRRSGLRPRCRNFFSNPNAQQRPQ